MKNRWCKIVEVLDHQVLFFLEPGEEGVNLHQMIHFNGTCCDSQIRKIPEDHAKIIFEGIDDKTAEVVVKTIEDLIEQNA